MSVLRCALINLNGNHILINFVSFELSKPHFQLYGGTLK